MRWQMAIVLKVGDYFEVISNQKGDLDSLKVNLKFLRKGSIKCQRVNFGLDGF